MKIIFGKPDIRKKDIDDVTNVLSSGWLGTGPKVKEFESLFSKYKGTKDALALNSCTSAIHLALIASGVGRGDEVITSAMTFAATANTILHCSAKPILVDCDVNGLINPNLIEEKITNKTKAIIVVHYAGLSCDMDKIISIAKKNKLKIIEDCAHAIETTYKGNKAGTIGDFGCFSFYSTKNIGIGEGGMLISKNLDDLKMCRTNSLHGMSRDAWKRFKGDNKYSHYDVLYPGYKYNMMDIQASLAISQFNRIEEVKSSRSKIWNQYNKSFKNSNFFDIPNEINLYENSFHSKHLYILRLKNEYIEHRDDVLDYMFENNIGTGVHYLSLTQLKLYKKMGFECQVAEKIGRSCFSLPIGTNLSSNEVNHITETLNRWKVKKN